MTIISERLKALRKEKKKTMAEMAKETGLSISAIGNYENGIREPRYEQMDILTDYFNVDSDYVRGKTDVKNSLNITGVFEEGFKQGKEEVMKNLPLRTVPIYDRLSCGTGTWIDERPEDYLMVPDQMISAHKSYFGNQAEGNSMEPGIRDGDYLVFEQLPEIPNGLIGSFSLNGQYYCKRFKKYQDGSCWLISDNPEYSPIPINPSDDFRVLGLYRLKVSKEQ